MWHLKTSCDSSGAILGIWTTHRGARDNEINPDVLGYIFEKYINQKAFGAYYTRSEITEYLCERSIHSVILERVNQHSVRQFSDLSDVLMRLDAELCRILLFTVLA